MKKKSLRLLCGFVLTISLLAGCAQKNQAVEEKTTAEDTLSVNTETIAEVENTKFYIYSQDDTMQKHLQQAFADNQQALNRLEFVTIEESEAYYSTIEQLLQAPDAEDYPDMFCWDSSEGIAYVSSEDLLPVTNCNVTKEDLAGMYSYTTGLATDSLSGAVQGVTEQINPGCFFYRSDLASELLGVNSPEEMQEKLAGWDSFLQTADEVNSKSGGAVKLLASYEDVKPVFERSKTTPWVNEEQLFGMSGTMFDYMDVSRALVQGELTAGIVLETPAWYAGIAGDTVMGYFATDELTPETLGDYCSGTAGGEGSFGQWQMCQGPVAYYLKTTYMSATSGCSDTAFAGEIMKTLCCDKEEMLKNANSENIMPNHIDAMQELAGSSNGAYEWLAGQNSIELRAAIAQTIMGTSVSKYDSKIDELLAEQITEYAAGTKDKVTAMSDFMAAVALECPTVVVDVRQPETEEVTE